MRPIIPLGTSALFLALCFSFAAAEEKPFGIEKFVPVDTSRLMGSPDPLPPLEIEKAFPNLRFERPLQIAHAGDGTHRLFAVTQKGIIYVFPNRPDATERECKVFLDWSKVAQLVENEEGMMGVAFHPKFKENGTFYVYYTRRPLQSVLARFRVMKDDTDRADPDSFEILMNFPQPYWNHNGGSLEFGPDGYLYLGLGDGGSGNDPHRNGQNLNTFLGKVLRIDVDREDPGRKYAIPRDNPFADRGEGVKGEIWAYGVRNIWRLSFDRLTGALWAGDVGQNKYEEVDILVKGGNYGWNLKEGFHDFRPDLAKGDEKLIAPIIDYGRGIGQCVIGGVVYRGKALPELYGAYLYSDYNTGHVWALRYDGAKMTGNLEIVRRKKEISSFGQDESDEVLFTCFDGYIYKFRKAEKQSTEEPYFPRRLSETGFFASTKTMTPVAGLIPYDVNVPLWSDGAAKERYIALPAGKKIGFSPAGQWEFPVGAVLVKTFFLDAANGDPATRRRLETRFMVHNEREWVGYTYLWNDEQTDAALMDAAATIDYRVKTPQGEMTQSWYYPSRADCMNCHTPAAGFVLGPNTRQMNREHDFGKAKDNQIRTLDHLGVFGESLAASADKMEAYPDWNEAIRRQKNAKSAKETTTLARAYLDVNCAICHCPGGISDNSLDMRLHTPLVETKLLGTPPAKGDYGPEGSKIIVPGDPDRSILLLRMKARDQGRMPNVATSKVDDDAVEIIRQWIESLK
ncbi:MAG: PQQ-dependent sugar dehydrogenase [Pirellulales bacterium]|nr:PQQ-dependent sugar dehydrogenase [Pirellulales bacterium]